MGEILLVGDRVLISAEDEEQLTDSGILLPASIADKDRVRRGRVVRVGPGYLTANPEYSSEPWRKPHDAVRYLPLQAEPGDVAFFLRKEAIEMRLEGKPYLIVQHSAIVALVRPGPGDLLKSIQGLLDGDAGSH